MIRHCKTPSRNSLILTFLWSHTRSNQAVGPMSHRFFLNSENSNLQSGDSLTSGQTLCLTGDQAHHAINVMRFKVGDELVLFDGSGTEHTATIEVVKKKSLEVTIGKSSEGGQFLATQITIAVALPKGDRQKFLIEKLVELGVFGLIPIKTKRSVAVPNEKVISRLKKQVVEACKQCGRNTLMDIASPQTLTQLTGAINSEKDSDSSSSPTTLLIADPYSEDLISKREATSKVLIAVGPEGGFDEQENESLAKAGFQPTKIGNAILRIETACIAAASILGIGQER